MTEWLQSLDTLWIDRAGWTLLHSIWQGAVVAALGLMVIVGMRLAPAQIRYATLLCLFCGLPLCPIVTFFVIGQTSESVDAPSDETKTVAVGVAGSWNAGMPGTDEAIAERTTTTSSPVNEAPLAPDPVGSDADRVQLLEAPLSADAAGVGTTTTETFRDRLQRSANDWIPWVVLTWCVGVVLSTLRLGQATWRLHRIVRRKCQPLSAAWHQQADRLREQLGIRRHVRFLESSESSVPMVVRWLQPIIIVPSAILLRLSPTDIEALLIHELAHIRRRDDVVNLLQAVVETLLFYHPAVWWLSAKIRDERENCCDDLAVEVVGDRIAYSRALVSAAELAIGSSPALAVASNDGELLQRVKRILGKSERPTISIGQFGVLAMIVCTLTVTAIGFGFDDTNTKAVEPPPTPIAPAPDDPIDAKSKANNFASEPLPLGASFQLGNGQFQIGSQIVRFLPDNKSVVVSLRTKSRMFGETSTDVKPAAIVDAQTGRIVKRVGPATDEHSMWRVLAVSGDGQRIAYSRGVSPRDMNRYWLTPWGAPTHEIVLHDTVTDKRICKINIVNSGRETSALNHDGSRLAVVGRMNGKAQIEVWDVKKGRVLKKTPFEHGNDVDSMAIDRDGNSIAVADSFDVWMWDWQTSDKPVVFEPHGATAVAFSLDGKHVGTGRGGAPEGRLWDRASGKKLFQFKTSGSLVVAFSPDSKKYVLPSGYSTYIDLIDVSTGKQDWRVDTGGIAVKDVAVSSDGKLMAAVGGSPALRVWEFGSGNLISDFTLHSQPVRDLRFSPNRPQLITGGMDGLIATWDTNSGQVIQTLRQPDRHWAGAVNFSADGKYTVATSLDDKTRVWDADSGKLIREFKGHGTNGAVYAAAITTDGRLLTYGHDREIAIHELTSGKLMSRVSNNRGPDHRPARIAANGSVIAVPNDKFVDVLNPATGEKRVSIMTNSSSYGFDISPDGKTLATCTSLYDATTGEVLFKFPVEAGRGGDVKFSPDGKFVAVASRRIEQTPGSRNRVWLVNTETKKTVVAYGPASQPYSVAVSNQGEKVAIACENNAVYVYRPDRFAEVGKLGQNAAPVDRGKVEPAKADRDRKATDKTDKTTGKPKEDAKTVIDTPAVKAFLDRVEVAKRGPFGGKPKRHERNDAGQIVSLKLGRADLKPADYPIIGTLEHLESLDLYSTKVTDNDMQHLAGLTRLKTLILNWTKITGDGLAHIRNMKDLETLEVRLTKITDKDVPVIAGLKKLRRLKISDTAITDEAVKLIATLPELRTLKLGDTKITDAAIKTLVGMKQLEAVTLDGAEISPAGLKELAQHPKLKWVENHELTIREYIFRAETSQFESIEQMSAPGIYLPASGRYRLIRLLPIKQTDRDKQRARHRYRIEFQWTVPERKQDNLIFIQVGAERGTIHGHEVGLIEE